MTVQEILSAIRKRYLALTAVIVAMSGLMGTVQYGVLRDQYTSSTTLYFVNNASEEAGISTSDIAVSEKLLADYQEILVSRRVLEAASADVGQTIAPEAVRANLVNGTHVICLSVTADTPERAAQHTNVITGHFISVATEILHIDSVSVIDRAIPRDKPSGPRRARNVLLTSGLTFLLGAAAIVARSLLDTTLHTREELEEKVGIPVLATVPRFRSQKRVGLAFEEVPHVERP